MNPGRNDPCPCGSSKKFKKCCIKERERAARTMADVIAMSIVSGDDPLMNRVQRDAGDIAVSFDALTQDAVRHLEQMYGASGALIYAGLINSQAHGDEL